MKDKIAFAVGLLGVVIALAPFKDQLSITYLNFGFASVNILTLAYISLGILFLSTYAYALQFVRDGFKFLDGLPVFRYLEITGNILYFVAVLSPLIYLAVWVIVQLFLLIPLPSIDIEKYTSPISIILSLIASFISFRGALRKNKEQMVAKEESLEASAISAASEAKKLVEQRMWSLSIIEAFRALEFSINKKMVELGMDTQQKPIFRSTEVLVRNGVLSKDDFEKIQYVRDLRNKAVHSSIEYSKDEALEVLNIVKQLISKLETKATKEQSLESKILDAIVGEKGLFTRNHFKTSGGSNDEIYDAKAVGPDYIYFVEIKFSTNLKVIKSAIRKVRHMAGQKGRIIIVAPSSAPKIILDEKDARILYYDAERNTFTNREQIHEWIYGKRKNKPA